MPEAFYLPAGKRYAATELTRGPWDPDTQHAGPPAALVGREIERAGRIEGAQLARLTLEILRPIPIAELSVTAEVVRGGRSVELLEATLAAGDDELVRARGWRIATGTVDVSEAVLPAEERPAGPEGLPGDAPFFPTGHDTGYHTAMEVRFASGGFLERGPAQAWMRMRVPLVAGEEPSPAIRVLVVADSGNGASATLDYRRYLFINTDLTVNLLRPPEGEWVCLDAITLPEPHGVGLAEAALFDERGRIGRATQTLLVAER